MSGLKLKVVPQFPAQVLGGPGIDVSKSNGNFSIDLDYSEFPQVSSLPATNQYSLVYDGVRQTYVLAPLSLMGGGGGIADAPTDGQAYGRSMSAWTPILPLSGGTLTGALTLAADPTNPLGAATKEYVDAHAGGAVANPSATIGLTPINGVATTATRSDAAPALSQAIVPTWTGKHTFVGPTAGTNDAVFIQNTSYTTNITRFGTPLAVVNANGSSNGLVSCLNNDTAANSGLSPVAMVGSAVIQNSGNTAWGGYFECHQYNTGVGNGVEIDSFNYSGAPATTLPPNRASGSGAPILPVGLTVVPAGLAGFSGQTCYDGAIGIEIAKQGSVSTKFAAAGMYVDPGAVGNFGVYVDATTSLGVTNAAGRFDIAGTGTETGVFIGVHGGATTANAIRVNNGGTDRFVVDTLGNINAAGGAWTAYTPTLSTLSGSLTTASATGRWKAIGKTVFFSVSVSITTNGTGAGTLDFTLPVAAAAAHTFIGREIAVNGKAATGSVGAGATLVSCQNYDNTYPGVNGAALVFSGCFESQ